MKKVYFMIFVFWLLVCIAIVSFKIGLIHKKEEKDNDHIFLHPNPVNPINLIDL